MMVKCSLLRQTASLEIAETFNGQKEVILMSEDRKEDGPVVFGPAWILAFGCPYCGDFDCQGERKREKE